MEDCYEINYWANENRAPNKKNNKVYAHFCLLLALLSAFILSMYHFTYIIFQYDLGITLLRISIILSVSAIICALAFNRIKKDL